MALQNYFYTNFRPNTGQLIRRTALKKIDPVKAE